MSEKLNIDRIWWRNVQPGEFYNIERIHKIEGGGGSLYIEIPSSMVPITLDFLDASKANVDVLPVITIQAGVIGKPGSRMRIARQNRQQPNSQRHPAWTPARGFPTAPDNVRNKEEAFPYFPQGGLRIYIAKTVEGDYYAGFTKGHRPTNLKPNDPMWNLYPQGNIVGGVIEAD